MIEEYKRMLKERGLSGKEMAAELGLSYGSYRAMTRSSAGVVPKWVVGFVVGCRLSEKICDEPQAVDVEDVSKIGDK